MKELLAILNLDDPSAAQAAIQKIERQGGQVTQRFGSRVVILEAPPELAQSLEGHPGVIGVYQDTVPDDVILLLDETGQMGIAAWNERHSAAFAESKRNRKGEGLPWDHPGFEREG